MNSFSAAIFWLTDTTISTKSAATKFGAQARTDSTSPKRIDARITTM
eukprot:SAG11_NODE_29786_length_307_cov_0.966346_1_plen_46_part_10